MDPEKKEETRQDSTASDPTRERARLPSLFQTREARQQKPPKNGSSKVRIDCQPLPQLFPRVCWHGGDLPRRHHSPPSVPTPRPNSPKCRRITWPVPRSVRSSPDTRAEAVQMRAITRTCFKPIPPCLVLSSQPVITHIQNPISSPFSKNIYPPIPPTAAREKTLSLPSTHLITYRPIQYLASSTYCPYSTHCTHTHTYFFSFSDGVMPFNCQRVLHCIRIRISMEPTHHHPKKPPTSLHSLLHTPCAVPAPSWILSLLLSPRPIHMLNTEAGRS
jgi:hypothetical protein